MNNVNTDFVIWNAQSIRPKSLELSYTLWVKRVRLCMICETSLNNTDTLFNPHFMTYRLDRVGRGGGVALLVSRDLRQRLLPIPRTKVVEAIALEVFLGTRRVTFVSIYFPGSSNPLTLEHFRADIRLLLSLSPNVILEGDFNCRHGFWGCQRSNSAGRVLFLEVTGGDCSIFFPGSPTHFPRQWPYSFNIGFFGG